MAKQQPKTDCFAFEQRMKTIDCACLKKLYCTEGKCKFYMSKEDYEKKNGKTYEQAMIDLDNYIKGYSKRSNEGELD